VPGLEILLSPNRFFINIRAITEKPDILTPIRKSDGGGTLFMIERKGMILAIVITVIHHMAKYMDP
jgi:hypothetical protein